MPKKKPEALPLRAPTDREAQAIASAQKTLSALPARPSMAVGERNGALDVSVPHSDGAGAFDFIEAAFGTGSSDFALHGLTQLVQLSHEAGKGPDARRLNANLALVAAVAPQNELEAALALQMAATHELTMHVTEKLKHAGRLDQMKEYGNLATKLSRTFATQMKTLSDWRRGGEQVVRHVHVYQGGQAVVAETLNVGAQNENLLGQCHAFGPALSGPHSQGNGVPVPSREGEEALPHAWRDEPGCTEGE